MRRAALRPEFCSMMFGVDVFGRSSLRENIAVSTTGTYMLVRRWNALEVTFTDETSSTFWKPIRWDLILRSPVHRKRVEPQFMLKSVDSNRISPFPHFSGES
jgi:hypothetical protein